MHENPSGTVVLALDCALEFCDGGVEALAGGDQFGVEAAELGIALGEGGFPGFDLLAGGGDFGFEDVGCCRIRGSGKGGFFGGFLSGCDGFLQHGDVSLKCGGTLALTRRKFLGGGEFALGRGQGLIGLAFLEPLAGDQSGKHEATDGIKDGKDAGFHASRVGVLRFKAHFFDSSISDGIEHAENLPMASLGIGGDEDASFVWLGFGFEARGDF